MIVWLASYPRSGNTALRSILHHVFGLYTRSLYDDKSDIGSRLEFAEAVGHLDHGSSPQAFYAQAASADETFFVKTHDPPSDEAKAIYVVRDGRSAIVSFYHYLRDFASYPRTLTEIIFGRCPFGSWSEHFEAWSPRTRPNTLLLRYEEIAEGKGVIKSIADFIGRPILRPELPKFAELQEIDARFFRSGSDTKNIAELQGDDLILFWLMHGNLMSELGHAQDDLVYLGLPSTFRGVAGQLREHTLEVRKELTRTEGLILQRDAMITALRDDIEQLRAALASSGADGEARLSVIRHRDAEITTTQKEIERMALLLAQSKADQKTQQSLIDERNRQIQSTRWLARNLLTRLYGLRFRLR